MNQEVLELLNGTLGLFLFLVTLIVIRDLKKKINLRESGLQVPIALFIIAILVFSIGELYKYGPFAINIDPIIAELFETVYLLLTFGAVFFLLGFKKP